MGGGIDCAAAAASSPALVGSRALGGRGPASLELLVGGNPLALVPTGCLLAHGATVPDSAADDGVPLLLARGASSPSPGSSMAVGPRAQGAAVPMVGLGFLRVQGAAVFVAVLVDGMLAAWLAHGAWVLG